MRVLFYLRVSSIGQEDGDGYARQRAACQTFAAKHGLQIVFIVEEAVSGTVEGMDRPKLSEFLNRNAKRDHDDPAHFEAVIVERLDRLARELMTQELLIRELQKLGVKLFATDQGELVDFAESCPDPTRKLIRQVLGAVAEFEKTNLVRKLAVARARVKAETGRCGGGIPYGQKTGEAPVLALMWQLRDTMSLRGLADFLNNGGFRQRNGGPWSFSAVSNILNHGKKASAL